MLWNRAPDKTPRPHFSRHDSGNVGAANARIAELKAAEGGWNTRSAVLEARELLGLVTPPEELPSWAWFDPRRTVVDRCLTHELLGDPGRPAMAAQRPPERAEWWPGQAIAFINFAWRERLPAAARAVLTARGCRWPMGEVGSEDFRFCNEKRRVGSSYCVRHADRCERREGGSSIA
jgi:hypothetical protein